MNNQIPQDELDESATHLLRTALELSRFARDYLAEAVPSPAAISGVALEAWEHHARTAEAAAQRHRLVLDAYRRQTEGLA